MNPLKKRIKRHKKRILMESKWTTWVANWVVDVRWGDVRKIEESK